VLQVHQSFHCCELPAQRGQILVPLCSFSLVHACCRSATNRTLAPCIKAVTDKVARWEKVPDCREPFTIKMWKCLFSLRDLCPPDGIINSVANWAACGLCGGFRKTEWAQDDGHAALNNPQLDIHGVPKAFRLADIVWKTGSSIRPSLPDALADEDSVGRAMLTFKAQKNGDNGATRLFTRNDSFPNVCFIRCLLCIVKRSIRLVGANSDCQNLAFSDVEAVPQGI
jgi:hypothetical protein